jgi:GTP-binding protein
VAFRLRARWHLTSADILINDPSSQLPAWPVEFLGSFPDPRHPLEPELPEVAFLGRSNVGKSTLLNALVGSRVARISGTPGKTQLLNVFRVPSLYLLDLPGYGYARVSKGERARFRALLEGVVSRRERVFGVVWLLDIRHPPTQDDYDLGEVLTRSGRAVFAVLTKADKLPRAQQLKAHRERARELGIDPDELLTTSGSTQLGIAELRAALLEAAGD